MAEREQAEVQKTEPKEEPMAGKSAKGLVKMQKDGQTINAHPETVKHHEGKGWKVAHA